MFARLTIAHRIWAPTLGLAVMLLAAGSLTTLRTQALISQGAAEQGAQQARLETALTWRGRAAAGETVDAEAARAHTLADSAAESALLARIAAQVDGSARLAAIDELVALQRGRSSEMRERAAADRMRTVWAVLALMAFIVAVSALGAWSLVRTIRRPLAELREYARRIGAGDLAVRIEPSRQDEIGDVMRSLAQMRDALRAVVGDVQASARQIRLASSEVASGNADLSRRTEFTAGRLQRSATSMAELTAAVACSAKSAAEARRLAGNACAVAREGGEIVARVVSTMHDIDGASQRIANIIGVIDGIAFQTNILALNAAVEAARAGEQGRGFAVVASEVRSLAQRSADAAKEIKTLIDHSVDKARDGSALVGSAGKTMSQIVTSVEHAANLVEAIADASAQQDAGIAEVNGAVAELERMTQQNAALVEQAAAAALSMEHQSVRLTGAVASFRLDDAEPTTLAHQVIGRARRSALAEADAPTASG